MNFDEVVEQRGSGSAKWEGLEAFCGITAPDALPMWIAQMDFAPAPVLTKAAQAFTDRGQYGYFRGVEEMFDRVAWWWQTRFDTALDPDHMRATHGLGNAIGLCLQAYTDPGDGVIIFTPVYHEFTGKTVRNGRTVTESPLIVDPEGRFQLDLEGLEARLTGREKIMLISAPHNPAGRIWTVAELTAMGDFCARHDLILISDEIHADLTFPGQSHVTAAKAIPQHADRLVVMTAASKTFDIAGLRVSTVVIPDAALRARFDWLHRALDIQPNRAGVDLTKAAYTPEGAAWVDALQAYLAENDRLLTEGLSAIPGVRVAPMEGTYLAWVDFENTGLTLDELNDRVLGQARIAPSPGPSMGTGGAHCMRFNIGTPRARVEDAVSRLRAAFSDIQ